MNSLQFRHAAEARYASACVLQRSEGHGTDAIYLAGYAVECALKALILKRTPASDYAKLIKGPLFRSALGHNFDALIRHLRFDCGEQLPANFVNQIRRAAPLWSPSTRYTSARTRMRISARFLAEVEQITTWINERL